MAFLNPEQEIVPIQSEVIKGSKRTVTTLLQRRSWAKIYAHLTPAMQDAAREIELAHTHITSQLGYVSLDFYSVKGFSSLEASEYIATIMARYSKWKTCAPIITNKVINMFVGGKTLTDLSKQYGLSKKTCMKHVREGLNEYSKIAGWGDQITSP